MPLEPADLERLLDPAFMEDLPGRSTEDIRLSRTALQEAEVAISFMRRLLQGRLDIVEAERARRGEDSQDTRSLVESLPDILSEGGRTSGNGRLPTYINPGEQAAALVVELDRVADPGMLTQVPELSDAALDGIVTALTDLEHEVSGRRRALHERLDAINAELVRRYQTGQASVDTLLR